MNGMEDGDMFVLTVPHDDVRDTWSSDNNQNSQQHWMNRPYEGAYALCVINLHSLWLGSLGILLHLCK